MKTAKNAEAHSRSTNLLPTRFLTLNCQGGVHPILQARLQDFFRRILDLGSYDFLLLQEVNANVFSLLQHPAYKTIRVFDEEAGSESELCIVYRSSYSLVSTGFKSFAPLQYRKYQGGFKCPTFGALRADINTTLLDPDLQPRFMAALFHAAHNKGFLPVEHNDRTYLVSTTVRGSDATLHIS
jgi:hypothetical protein